MLDYLFRTSSPENYLQNTSRKIEQSYYSVLFTLHVTINAGYYLKNKYKKWKKIRQSENLEAQGKTQWGVA